MSREKLLINNPKSNNSEDMRNKQIEELKAMLLEDCGSDCENCEFYKMKLCYDNYLANRLYNAGYRKQSEGEWKLHKDGSGTCSECHFIQKDIWDYDHYQHFCGHCGAKMKGGEE